MILFYHSKTTREILGINTLHLKKKSPQSYILLMNDHTSYKLYFMVAGEEVCLLHKSRFSWNKFFIIIVGLKAIQWIGIVAI